MEATRVIAVDGPAAAGKTTASLAIAAARELAYLESGRAYRLLAFTALSNDVALDDEGRLIALCDDEFLAGYKTLVAGSRSDLQFLRDPGVGRAVSHVAKLPEIRARITALTRSWAEETDGCIVEGRDIGTIVFPDAYIKFYLDAVPEVRAVRRLADEPGNTYASVLSDVVRRDELDSTRKDSPLRPAPDAAIIDTSSMSIAEVFDRMSTILSTTSTKSDAGDNSVGVGQQGS